MANQQRQPNLSKPSEQAKQDELERNERQEQASEADATARPASRVTPGRKPLFRA